LQNHNDKISKLLRENIEFYSFLKRYNKKQNKIENKINKINKIEKKEYKEPEFDEYDNTKNDYNIEEFEFD